jgi:hypothetical protein
MRDLVDRVARTVMQLERDDIAGIRELLKDWRLLGSGHEQSLCLNEVFVEATRTEREFSY